MQRAASTDGRQWWARCPRSRGKPEAAASAKTVRARVAYISFRGRATIRKNYYYDRYRRAREPQLQPGLQRRARALLNGVYTYPVDPQGDSRASSLTPEMVQRETRREEAHETRHWLASHAEICRFCCRDIVDGCFVDFIVDGNSWMFLTRFFRSSSNRLSEGRPIVSSSFVRQLLQQRSDIYRYLEKLYLRDIDAVSGEALLSI